MTELHAPLGRLAASDELRLTLQTKLTEFGIPPEPEDRGALRQLAELDAVSVDAVIRWLTCAARLGARAGAAYGTRAYGAGARASGAHGAGAGGAHGAGAGASSAGTSGAGAYGAGVPGAGAYGAGAPSPASPPVPERGPKGAAAWPEPVTDPRLLPW